MNNDSLFLITNNYPLGGRTEEAFLKDEIVVLANSFRKIVVLPMNVAENCFDISWWPTNVTLDDGLARQYREYGKLRYLNLFRWSLLWACLREIGTLNNRVQLEYLIRSFIEGRTLSKYLTELVRNGNLNVDKTVIYSFWFADDAVGLGLMPKSIMPRWISRAHHYDLYNDRVPIRSKVFRNKSFANVEKVLCCSEHGADYLAAHYPKWKSKIGTLYLGTSKPVCVPEYQAHENCVNFVTVARMEPVKRPLQTFDLLCSLANHFKDKNFTWTYIGGGSLFDKMQELCQKKPANFTVKLLGEQPNAVVQNMLMEGIFDWMVLLSESEGLPISIAEAMSYGIPTIATNVGGVGEEVVSGISGILLPSNPTFDSLIEELSPYLDNQDDYLKLRETAQNFWQENLDGEKLKQQLTMVLSNN